MSKCEPLGAHGELFGGGSQGREVLWQCFAGRGAYLILGEGIQAQRRERMNSAPPHLPAPSRQLPTTLLKIPGPGPSAPGLSVPGRSAPGLEVAQSWGNPGR